MIHQQSSSLRRKHRRPTSHLSSSISMTASTSTRGKRIKPYCCRGGATLPSSLIVLCTLLLCYITWKWIAISKSPPSHPPPRYYTFDIVNEFPHDPEAFTQGLVYGGNELLFESTGLYHRSSVRQVQLQTGKVQVSHRMDDSFFGEGLTLLGERLPPNFLAIINHLLFQVTWLTTTGFIYDRYNFSNWENFIHQMSDGWGLATDGRVLFGSDGSSTLYHLDPQTFEVTRKVTVRYNDHEVTYLNELEYVNGEVWANVLLSDCIVRISPENGIVLGWILLHELRRGLLTSGHTGIDVLNGIAWDDKNNRLFVTGKLWPKLYQINIHPINGPNGSIEDICHLKV